MNHTEAFEAVRSHKLERSGEDTWFPKIGEFGCEWQKEYPTAQELMDSTHLQLWVQPPESLGYQIWKHAGTTNVSDIAKNWSTIKPILSTQAELETSISKVSHVLTDFVLRNYNKENDFPLFIIGNDRIRPMRYGNIFDGNHRLLSILTSLCEGEIQASTPIPVWTAQISAPIVTAFNIADWNRLKMPLREKIRLLEERTNLGNK